MLKLKSELSGVFQASGVSLERQFRGFDTNSDGSIDHDEFRNGLASLGANVSEAQIDDLIMILDQDGDGEIDYQEFAAWFGAGPPPPPILPEVKARMDASEITPALGMSQPESTVSAYRAQKLLERRKQKADAKAAAEAASQPEGEMFRLLDKDGDGLVTVEEIVDGLGVTEKEAAKILKKHGGKGGMSAEQVMDKKADKALRKVRQKQEDEEER